MTDPELLVQVLARAFEAVGITYWVGGSMASIAYGFPRLTHDVDVVADIREDQIDAFIARLGDGFYADADTIHEAVRTRSTFNVIYLPTMMKADIFVMETTEWARSERARRSLRRVGPSPESKPVYVASAEDMVLQKLHWFRLTGERSDRQWGDVQGVLKVQGTALDFAYLRHWAVERNLSDLLDRALEDAGLTEPGNAWTPCSGKTACNPPPQPL